MCSQIVCCYHMVYVCYPAGQTGLPCKYRFESKGQSKDSEDGSFQGAKDYGFSSFLFIASPLPEKTPLINAAVASY